MTANEMWTHVLSIENFYAEYRKRIMNRFVLSAAETDVLMFLANNPGFDTASHISKIRKIPKSQVSLAVNSLCEKGLLVGVFTQNNKKSIHLSPTDKAQTITDYGKTVQKEFICALFNGFSDEEIAEFKRFYTKISDNIKKGRRN